MNARILLLLLAFFINVGLVTFGQEINHDHSVHHSFLENKGQWPSQVLFKTNLDVGNLWVEQGRLIFHIQDFTELQNAHALKKESSNDKPVSFKQDIVLLDFINANNVTNIEKEGETEHYYNYFRGNNPDHWASNVRGYDEFTLRDFYNDIDLRFIEKEQELKYEFIIKPSANPNQIKWKYNNAKQVKVNKKGGLVVKTELGDIIEKAPYVYQIINGRVVEVNCSFKLEEGVVSFELAEFNEFVDLIIDPTLVFATYNGAVSDNFGMTATYAHDGSAYVAGTVFGNDYPIPDLNVFDPDGNLTVQNVGVVTTDAFITKYSPDGSNMIWSTFYGGGDDTQGTDVPHSLISDLDDNIYVYGVTSSLDFPIQGGFQSTHAGGTALTFNSIGANFGNVGTDIYVAKFSANGYNLLGSTYVGGTGNDGVNYKVTSGNYGAPSDYDSLTMNYGDQLRGEIGLDANNNILVASSTRSTDFPVVDPFQPNNNGQQDGVVFKLRNDFSELLWSSYFGGSENDGCYSVKIDESDNILFAGGTSSSDLPMVGGGYLDTYQGGKADGFVIKLSPNGLNIDFSTYLGTNDYDQVYFVDVDRNDMVYVLGQTLGGDYPVVGPVYENPGSTQFVTQLEPDLSAINLSTVFGSEEPNIDISPSAFLIDICGNIYISGWGRNLLQSTLFLQNMPITPNAFQTSAPNGFDFYLLVLEREMSNVLYGTYMGGVDSREHVDGGTSRFDRNGVVYQGVCGGCGGNSDFPTTAGAWSNDNLANNCNALVFKFDFNLIPNAEFTVENNLGCAPFEVTFDNFSSDSDAYIWDFGDGNLDSTTFEPTITYEDPGVYEVNLYVTDSICLITDSATLIITVTPELELDDLIDIEQCEPSEINLIANSFGTADSFVWSTNPDFTDTLNVSISDSTANVFTTESGYYYIQLSNPGCELIDSIEVVFTSSSLSLEGDTTICLGDEAVITATGNDPGITFSNFQWTPESVVVSGQGTDEVTVNPTMTQFINVTAEASNGCIVTDSILIEVSDIDPLSVNALVSEEEVPVGSTVTLTAEPDGYSYNWFPPILVVDPNSQVTDAVVNQTTTYTVFVTDGICTQEASVEVKVFEFVCEEPFVFVPNAFTPNGDGDNDVLYARSTIIDDTEDFIFRIYNRWGEKVFETNDITEGWDGTWRGDKVKPDVYDYYLEGFCIDGQSFLIQGNVTLIR